MVAALSRSRDDGAVESRLEGENPGPHEREHQQCRQQSCARRGRRWRTTIVLAIPAGATRPGASTCLGGGVGRTSCVTRSRNSASARIASSPAVQRALQSSRRPWQVRQRPRWRDRASRRAAGSTTARAGPPACRSPSRCWAAASSCRSSPHPEPSIPCSPSLASAPVSAAASAVTSKARRMACWFSLRRRRTSAADVPSSRAALRLSRPRATNSSYICCRGSGSVATICSSHWRSGASLAGCPPSFAVMVATSFMTCGSAGHEDPTSDR